MKRLYRVELELALPVVAESGKEAQEIALAHFREEYVTEGDFWASSSDSWSSEELNALPWGENEDRTVAEWLDASKTEDSA